MSLTEGKEILAQCRLCTSKIGEHQNVEIFGPDGLAKDVAKKIEDCLPICVSRGDSFPQTVCLTCLEKLDRSYNFLKQCLNAELSFEQNWSKTHPGQSNEFSLEPECCLREVDGEATRPILFKAETLPQPKKRARGLEDFIILPIAPSMPSVMATSTPMSKPVTTGAPRLGFPDPDDYILVKEETLDVSNANANNLIEFYASKINQGSAKDVDIVAELRRRNEILPSMFDVYERHVRKDGQVPSTSVVRRRYIVNKESFPCTLCNGCFLVERGFPRSAGARPQQSHENDINFLNSPTDRNHNKRAKLEPVKRKPKTPKRAEMPILLPIQSPVGPAKQPVPKRVTQMIISTKHQFVGQMFKREPSNGVEELGSSVNSEDSESFNDLVIKNFYCELCNKYFPRRSSLKRHQRTHASDRIFSCPRCSKGFSRKEHLARHMLLHSEVRPFQCQVCLKTYTQKEHVERHILIHPQDPELEYRTRKFDLEQDLIYENLEMESQMNMVQDLKLDAAQQGIPTLERPYVCELCGHGFARKEHLQRHKRRMHTVAAGRTASAEDPKPYSCPICMKTFTRKEHLVRHNKIHIRESLMGSDDSNTIVLSEASLFLDVDPAAPSLPPPIAPSAPPFEALPPIMPAPPKMSADTMQTIKSLPERLPGLDVSLRVVEPRNVPTILQLAAAPLPPNKLDISISLVSESAAAPQPSAPKPEAPPPAAADMKPPESGSPDQPGRLNASEENLMSFLKPFTCEFCFNKRFTRKSHLVRHFKRIHPEKDVSAIAGPSDSKAERLEFNAETFVSNEDEHLCKICDKRFSRRYHLNRHLKLHIAMKSGKIKEYVEENARPFKCSSCEERFTKYEGFQSHRCTGTEVGSMVLVGNSMVGVSDGEGFKVKATKVRKRAIKGADAVAGPSKVRRVTKRDLALKLLKPGKRVRRKRSRVGYECEVCGVFLGTHKQLVKHMKTHKSLEDDEGVDVERELV